MFFSKRTYKTAVIVFVAVVLMMVSTKHCFGYETATDFQFPVAGYVVDGYYFGEPLGGGIYHLGEDCAKIPLTPVFAIANGYVTSQSGEHTDFGWVSVIEHRLPDGSYVCSVIGHLRKDGFRGVGDVKKGDIIGYVGYDDENGAGGPHIHIGIRDGSNPGYWVFYGRGSSTDGWHHPTDFILAHQNLFSCSYVSQTFLPMGPYERGDKVTLQLKFNNNGNSTWSNIPGENYVELASCNQIGEVGLSFFNYNPITETCFTKSVLDWENCFVPTTFEEGNVPPGGIATFNFEGIIREDALPIIQKVYFAPIFGGNIIHGWNDEPFQPFTVDLQKICNELPKELTPNSEAIDGQVCVGFFQQYFFPIVADGRNYKITVTPNTGDNPNVYASTDQNDINNSSALLNWATTCPDGSTNCGSSTQAGDAVEIIEFKAPDDGVNYTSWFSVYGAQGVAMVGYTVQVESFLAENIIGIDVVFVMDVTGSTGGLLPDWRSQMPNVIADIQSEFSDSRFGLVSHLDFPFEPYGGVGEWAYKLESPLSDDPAVTISALSSMTNGWGGDNPESQYEALYQTLTGEGCDLNCDGDFNDKGEIFPSNMGYDPDHLIILFHFTYPPSFHDRNDEPNYPFAGSCYSTGRTETHDIMREKPVIYFGLVTTSMEKILIDPQTDEAIESPIYFSEADPMQELADITGGAVLSVGSDLSGLEQAIRDVIDSIPLVLYGDLAVSVLSDSIPIPNVAVNIVDIDGNLVDRGFTNTAGSYFSDSLLGGSCFVSIIPPFGYSTNTSMIPCNIVLRGTTSVTFNLNRMNIVPTQQTLSYWKYMVSAAIYGSSKDDDIVNTYRFPLLADLIYNHFQNNPIHPIPVFGDSYPSSPRSKTLALLYLLGGDLPVIDTFAVPLDEVHRKVTVLDDGPWTYKIKATRELTALLLNVASNKLASRHVASVDGITVSQVITYTTDLIYDDDPTNDQEPYNILRYINSGKMLQAGSLPSNIPEVFYMLSVNGNNDLPTEFVLSQNYPNPFNPVTIISFNLPSASDVKLEVYNMLGQVVSTVYEGHLGVGQHSYSWNGSHVASGVYLYKLTAGDFVEMKNMVLLK